MDNLTDYASERLVIAGVFQHGYDAYLDISDILTDISFCHDTNALIFSAYQYLFDDKKLKRVDKASLFSAVNHLGQSGIWSDPDTVAHFRTIVNTTTNLDHVRVFAIKLKKLEIARVLQQKLKDAAKNLNDITGDEETQDIIAKAEEPIFAITAEINKGNPESQNIATDIEEYITYLENNVVETQGISTGYPLFNKALGGGLRRKTISMIAARSKQGKSFIATNVAMHTASMQIPTLLLDTEMDREQQLTRILPNLIYNMKTGTTVEIDELELGQFSKSSEKVNAVRIAGQKLKESKFYYQNISGASPDTVLSIIRRWVHKEVGYDDNGRTKDCLVIYDYIKLMDSSEIGKTMNEYQVIGFLMTNLHNAVVSMDIPILGFVQLNRDGCDKTSVQSVAQSDRIIWISSNFSIYKEKSPEEIASDGIMNGNMKLVPLITRFGSGLSAGDYINFNFLGKYGTLLELDTKYNLEHLHQQTTSTVVEVKSGEQVIQPGIDEDVNSL